MVATVSLPIAAGPILGPVLGGVILNWLDWRWLFLVNVPVCAVGLYLAWRFLPADAPASPGTRSRLDLPGLLLIAPGLAGILFGLSNVGQERRSRPRRRAGPADRRAGAADRVRGLDPPPGPGARP